ncbi:MAG: hypothetical protein EXS40_07225 [Opitutaceae bacterium]|nr:hypothetical protein [Opitutaceae bacterium]
MNLHSLAGWSRSHRWFLGISWLVIGVKCVVVWWAMPHDPMLINPLWVISPTVFFAACVTVLWTTHRE